MLTKFRAAYREGRAAEDKRRYDKLLKKALRRAGDAPMLQLRVSAHDHNLLLRMGWKQEGQSRLTLSGSGAGWADTYVMSLPRTSLDLISG